MMQSRTKRIIGSILGCLVALALVVGGYGIKAGRQDAKVAIPAEQVIASIRAATAATPGNVRGVEVENEVENEEGKTICGVKILAQDGKTYEVEVDVATNTVVEVEVDDDDDEDEDDEDGKD